MRAPLSVESLKGNGNLVKNLLTQMKETEEENRKTNENILAP